MPAILSQTSHRPWPLPSGPWVMTQTWYDLLFARKPTAVHKQALTAAAPQPGEKALDVGCGPGTTAIVLSQKVAPGGEDRKSTRLNSSHRL